MAHNVAARFIFICSTGDRQPHYGANTQTQYIHSASSRAHATQDDQAQYRSDAQSHVYPTGSRTQTTQGEHAPSGNPFPLQAPPQASSQGPSHSFTRAARDSIPTPLQVAERQVGDRQPGEKWYVVFVGTDVGVFPGQ